MAPLTARTKASAHALRKSHTVEVIISDLRTLQNESEFVSPSVTTLRGDESNQDQPPF